MNTIEQVKQFHEAFGLAIKDKPSLEDKNLNKLRMRLLTEECQELFYAIEDEDLVGVLDALSDIQYILDGTYLALGFHKVKDLSFMLVHASNMCKLGPDGKPIYRGDGKVLKPTNWQPPQLGFIINLLTAKL